ATCRPPAFDATPANLQFYEEQTEYYWVMQARQYAIDHLWVTPRLWTDGPIKHATTRLDPYILSEGGFNTACWPNPLAGCFRAWPTEGPRIFIKAGTISPELVGHEFGHYAAGYVFGHMDTFGFTVWDCAQRAFQEAIAEMFMIAFLHGERHDYYAGLDPVGDGRPSSSFSLSGTARWD